LRLATISSITFAHEIFCNASNPDRALLRKSGGCAVALVKAEAKADSSASATDTVAGSEAFALCSSATDTRPDTDGRAPELRRSHECASANFSR
jgi:hypothetical protein